MSSNPAPKEPETSLPPQPADEDGNPCLQHDAEFYCEILDEVMHTALGIARAIGQGIRDNPASTASERTAAAVAVDRIARTIRRCILLISKLKEGRPIRATTARARNQARARVRAEVQAAETRAPPQQATEPAARNERAERLDTLPAGTIPEIIAGFRKDLAAIAKKSPLPEGEGWVRGNPQAEARPRHRPPLRCEAVPAPRRADKPLRHPPTQPPEGTTHNRNHASPERLHHLNHVRQPTDPPRPTPATPRSMLGRMPCPHRST